LTSIVSTIGLVKAGLSGLGAVNIASAGASVASSAVASGLVNQYGRPISSAVAGAAGGAGAGRTIGSIALTAAKVSLIAGSVVFAYEAAKAITAIPSYPKGQGPFAEQMRMEGKTQVAHSKMTAEELADYNAYFYSDGKPKGVSQYKTAAGPIEPIKPIILTPEQAEKLKKEAEKASEIYWTNWFDWAEASAKQEYQVILGGMPSTLFQPSAWIEAQRVKYRDEATPSMPGGVPAISGLDISRAGLTSGLGLGLEVSKASQEREKSILKIAKIEKDVNDKFVADWQKGTDQINAVWNDHINDVTYSIDEIGNKWLDTASDIAKQMSMPIAEKGIDQLTGALFDESKLKSAWERYQKQYALDSQERIDMGRTESKELMMAYEEFSDNYKAQQDINKQTWKEFLSDMLAEWAKMLAKKLVMYGLEKAGEWAIDKMTKKEDMYAMDSPLVSGDLATSNTNLGLSDVSDIRPDRSGWHKAFDKVWGMSADEKAYKEAHPEQKSYATGGWIMKPTIALMGEREPELVIPKSKLGSSGLGGNTHIEIHNINVPTLDRQAAENLVVWAVEDARRHNRI